MGQARIPDLGEMSVPVIQEEPRAGSDAVNQEVQSAVSVHVGKRGAGREIAGKIEAGRGGNIGETPPAKVLVQGNLPFIGADENVAQTVSINISEGHARAIKADLVLGGVLLTQGVGKVNASLPGIHEGEARMARCWDLQGDTAIAGG